MSEQNKIKRIHVIVGAKATTFSMDETLFELLQARLIDKKLSVRGWAQGEIDQILSEKASLPLRKGVSLSRRLQARAIRVVAEGAGVGRPSAKPSSGVDHMDAGRTTRSAGSAAPWCSGRHPHRRVRAQSGAVPRVTVQEGAATPARSDPLGSETPPSAKDSSTQDP